MQALLAAHSASLRQLAEGNEAIEAILLGALAKLVAWQVPPDEDLSQAQAIFAFAFGQGPSGTPGRTNQALAAELLAVRETHPLRLFAQWEIVDALPDLDTAVAYTATPQKGYLSTRGVIEQFRAAWEMQFGEVMDTAVILIAHPDHQIRCRDLLQEAGFDPLIPVSSFPWEQFGCDAFGYDPASVQPWTRSRAAFVAYELSVRFGGKSIHERKEENHVHP